MKALGTATGILMSMLLGCGQKHANHASTGTAPATTTTSGIAVTSEGSAPSKASGNGEATGNAASQMVFSGAKPVFTTALVDPALLSVITPLGTAGTEGRTYIHPATCGATAAGVTVTMPMDGYVTNVYYYIHPGDNVLLWSINVQVSDDVMFSLAHLVTVNSTIAAMWNGPAIPANVPAPSKFTPTLLKEGTVIGTTNQCSWDFLSTDNSYENQFINMPRYLAGDGNGGYAHSTCPYDYFADDLKQQYYALFGQGYGPIKGANCGTISHDVAGMLSGQWFNTADISLGVNESTKALSFVYTADPNAYDQMDLTVSALNESGWLRLYANQLTYANPVTSTANCFQRFINDDQSNPQGWVYAQVNPENPDELQAAVSTTGECPAEFPATYSTYYR